MRDREKEMQFEPPVPHFDAGNLQRIASEQRRLGVKRFEIAADGNRFRDHGAVVEHQGGDPLQRIDRRVDLRLLLQGAEIDLLQGQRDALLGKKDPRAPRIGRPTSVVKLHVASPAPRRSATYGCILSSPHPTTAVGSGSRDAASTLGQAPGGAPQSYAARSPTDATKMRPAAAEASGPPARLAIAFRAPGLILPAHRRDDS